MTYAVTGSANIPNNPRPGRKRNGSTTLWRCPHTDLVRAAPMSGLVQGEAHLGLLGRFIDGTGLASTLIIGHHRGPKWSPERSHEKGTEACPAVRLTLAVS